MPHDQSDARLCVIPGAQAPPGLAQAPPSVGTPPRVEAGPVGHAPPAPTGRPKNGLRLDAESRRRIGRNLRVLYGDVLSQPLPERFAALLADLSARDETGGAA